MLNMGQVYNVNLVNSWLNNAITYADIPYDYIMINDYVIYRIRFKFPNNKLSKDNVFIKWHNNLYGCTIWLYHMIKWLMIISYISYYLLYIYFLYVFNICINNKKQRYMIYLLLLSKWLMLTIYCYLLLNKKYMSWA